MISQKLSKEFNPLTTCFLNHDGTLVFEEQNQSSLCTRIASHQNVLEKLPIIRFQTNSLLSNYEYVS